MTHKEPEEKKIKSNGWHDIIGQKDIEFLVILKESRVQVLKQPAKRIMKKRGKRGWSIVGIVNKKEHGVEAMLKLVRQAAQCQKADLVVDG